MSEPYLTSRELQFFRLLARGYNNRQIASTLEVTDLTVRYRIHNIYKRLKVPNRVAAIQWALEHGLDDQENGATPT